MLFATDPPGARVVLDGVDSGFVTPCHIALENKSAQRVDLELAGYETASRVVTNGSRAYAILWNEMIVSNNTWHFPLWLPIEDFVIPFKISRGSTPGRLFVRLRRSADQ